VEVDLGLTVCQDLRVRRLIVATGTKLERFLDDDGRVVVWPSRRADRLVVLAHLATLFDAELHYTEREVNALLDRVHTWGDPAFLRRILVGERFIDRTPTGRRYWRVATSFGSE
jgi:hypothetical protein